jgi:dipeptidyl aminopeptidase/acylaminoacyl peptidase
MRIARLVVAGLALVLLTATPAAATPDPTIPGAIARTQSGGELRASKAISSTDAYTRHRITYRSNDLTISGIMNRPKGEGPFPVVVLAHGYIDPDVYWSGQGFRREQDWLARNGYVALHVDYRNHAGSDNDPDGDLDMRIGYAEDVINAGLAVRNSRIPYLDRDRVAVLGRSMGGNVVYQALAIAPGVFDAAITYASVSSNVADNFNRWQRQRYDIAARILKAYGEPKANPELWQRMSARTYFDRITEPILAFHGTADATCDIRWARETQAALERAGVDARLVEYDGADHYFYGPWYDSIRQVDRFLAKHLD